MNKRLLVWLMILIGVIIVVLLFTRSKPSDQPITQEPGMPKIVVLDQNVMSDVESFQTLILDDQQAYQDFVKMHQLIIDPPVDLRERTVIAVFMGMRPTGGYSVEITDTEEKDGQLLVYVSLKSPGENCINIQAFTYPYQIVSIKKTNLPIEIVTESIVVDCP